MYLVCVYVCVFFFLFFFISDEKNTILFKEREKEKRKRKEKDKVVDPWEKRKERKKKGLVLLMGPTICNLFTKDHSTTLPKNKKWV